MVSNRLLAEVYDEAALEVELEDLYQKWGALGFWSKRFHQKVSPGRKRYIGGVAAVRGVLTSRTDGFSFLKECGRLDISVENLILEPEWSDLFNETDRELALKRLNLARKA